MNAVVLSTRHLVVDGWNADGLRAESIWRLQLEPRMRNEAARHVRRHGGRPGPTIARSDFPRLTQLASEARAALSTGPGLVWIRPTKWYDPDPVLARALLALVGSLLGTAHRPSTPAIRLDDPRAMATEVDDGIVPDLAGAVWLDDAAVGDELLAVSATAVHDEIAAHHLEHARALYRPVLHLTHPITDGADSGRSIRAPVFRYDRDARSLELRYARRRILPAHDLAGEPLRPVVREALDVLDKTMALPHLVATIRPRRGDIVLLHNRRVATSGLLHPAPGAAPRESRVMRVVEQPPPAIASARQPGWQRGHQ